MVKYRLPLGFNNSDVIGEMPCIGYICEDDPSHMYPNDNFRNIFATEWSELFGERPSPALKSIGMFAAVKAINTQTSVKDLLDSSFGVPKANALIDFAMYSILFKTNVADHFAADMHNYLLYSNSPHTDSYYSDLFKKGMPWKDVTTFNIGWVNWCKQNGVESVYLCIDGSNEDCDAKGVEFAEPGHNKSGKNKNIVSFTYAVTEDGMPVAYKVYRGGLIDAKAMRKIILFFTEINIQIKGVIIDRGYCEKNAFDFLRGKKIEYIVMVKGKPEGFKVAFEENSKFLRHNGDTFIPGTELYATQRMVKIFKKTEYEDCLTIFFDTKNASGQETALMKKINKEMERVQKQIEKGNEPKINGDMDRLLYIEDGLDEDGIASKYVRLNPIEYNEAIAEKGIYSILSSEYLSPKEIDRLYNCRDSSETTYSILKTQLGYGTMHIHCTLGTQSKYFVGFVCSIIRYFIEKNSLSLEIGTNQMIDELKKIEAQKLNKQYFYDNANKKIQINFFAKLGVPHNYLEEIVRDMNNHVLGITQNSRRKKPGPKKGSHHVQIDENGKIKKRKPGPKPGSKKTSINKDGSPRKKPGPKPGFKRGEYNADGSVRRKPGPKVGSKNRKSK